MDSSQPYQTGGAPLECLVCGAPSTGLHYGVITCEGCKVFYKRYSVKHEQYRCYFGGGCVINIHTRSRCRACRYKKCAELGMSVEAIRLGRTPKIHKTSPGTVTAATSVHSLTSGGSFGQPLRATATLVACRKSVIAHAPAVTDPHDDEIDQTESPGEDLDYPDSTSTTSENPHQRRALLKDKQLARLTHRHWPRLSAHSFATENLDFMVSEFARDCVRPCQLPDIRMPPSSTHLQASMELTTLQKYWGVIKARNLILEDSISTVTKAMDLVFSAHMKENAVFLAYWHDEGMVPEQPECTLHEMFVLIQGCVSAHAQRMLRFASPLPGFTDLSQTDRCTLVRDRWYTSWLITHSACYIDNECYLPIGENHVHYCRYWMKQMMLGPEFTRFLFLIAAAINDLHLNAPETSLLLAVALFRIDKADLVEDKAYADFLYAHYLDALVHLIGPRSDTMKRLRIVINLFSLVNEVHRRFILVTSMEETPASGTGWNSDEVVTVMRRDPQSYARNIIEAGNF